MTENAFFLAFVSSAFAIAPRSSGRRFLARPWCSCWSASASLRALPGPRALSDLRGCARAEAGVRPACPGRAERHRSRAGRAQAICAVGRRRPAPWRRLRGEQGAAGPRGGNGLGAYAGVLKVEYDPTNVRIWILDHFAEAQPVRCGHPDQRADPSRRARPGRPDDDSCRAAFLSVAASAFVLVVVEVGAYASRFSLRVEERNMFGVVPCSSWLSAWLAKGLRAPSS